MPRERICQYGNCHETNITITVNYRNEERPAFCCEDHAALWLMRQRAPTKSSVPAIDRLESALNRLEDQLLDLDRGV